MRTYEDVAASLSLELCSSCESFSPVTHMYGYAHNNTVHWRSRRLERRGLRKFLKLAARLRVHQYAKASPAMKVYLANAWATKAGAALRVRFPYAYTVDDRLWVQWLVVNGDHITTAARRWAHRKGTL